MISILSYSPRRSVIAAWLVFLTPWTCPGLPPGIPLVSQYVTLNKTASYVQSSSDASVLAPIFPFVTFANAIDDTNSITAAKIVTPEGRELVLAPETSAGVEIPGRIFSEPFDTAAAADVRFPKGSYDARIQYAFQGGLVGDARLSVPFLRVEYPPVPLLLNFAQAQCIDSSKEFILEFAPFPGASDQDTATLQIVRGFATSEILHRQTITPTNPGPVRISIPARLLATDEEYSCQMLYDGHAGIAYTNLLAGPAGPVILLLGRSSLSTSSFVGIRSRSCPRLRLRRSSEAPSWSIEFDSVAGRVYELESSRDLSTWRQVTSTNATQSAVNFFVPENSESGNEFFRVRSP